MKKVLLNLLVFLLTVSPALAQMGLEGGLTLSSLKYSYHYDDGTHHEDYDINYSTIMGFTLGINYRTALSEHIYFQPGLYLTQKGGLYKDDDGGESTIRLNYFDIPLQFQYEFPMENFSVYLYGEPQMNIGFSGTETYCEESSCAKDKIEFTTDASEKEGLRRFSLGAGFGAGVNYQNYYVRLGYFMNLIDLLPDQDGRYGSEHLGVRVISLSVGYRFM